ncbi:hypothetical protein VTL71DRAFT_12162, partial [Oculimacula yallundae]
MTSLFAAILWGKTEAAKLLIKNGVRVDEAVLDSEVTALHAAAYMLNAPLVKLLLERGADVNFGQYAHPLDWCYRAKGHQSEAATILKTAGGVIVKHSQPAVP